MTAESEFDYTKHKARMIVGFIGPIGSGKTTAANILRGRPGWGRYSFAAPLKGMLARLLQEWGMTYDKALLILEDRELRTQPHPAFGGKTPREAMQLLGTEWGRDLMHPDLWVKFFEQRIILAFITDVVLDDLRFPNECETIQRLGGMVVKLTGRQDKLTGPAALHSSEHQELPFDYQLDNSGNVRRLEYELDKLLLRHYWKEINP